MANRVKMSRGDRAKQFMPFAALKGYEKSLRQKEQMHGERECEHKEKRLSGGNE